MSEAINFPAELFPQAVIDGLTEQAVKTACERKHDLSRVDRRIVDMIASLRGAGVSVRACRDALGVSEHTVLAVGRYHPNLVATAKERAATTCFEVGHLIAEKLGQAALDDKLRPGEMGLSAGIMFTKAAELRGEATAVLEVRTETGDDFVARLKRVKSASVDVSTTVSACGTQQIAPAVVVGVVLGVDLPSAADTSDQIPGAGLGDLSDVGDLGDLGDLGDAGDVGLDAP